MTKIGVTSNNARFMTVAVTGEWVTGSATPCATADNFAAALARLDTLGRFSMCLLESPADSNRQRPQDLNHAFKWFREVVETLY